MKQSDPLDPYIPIKINKHEAKLLGMMVFWFLLVAFCLGTINVMLAIAWAATVQFVMCMISAYKNLQNKEGK